LELNILAKPKSFKIKIDVSDCLNKHTQLKG
jgi:hypothetical protein